jgi:hypothetical protein
MTSVIMPFSENISNETVLTLKRENDTVEDSKITFNEPFPQSLFDKVLKTLDLSFNDLLSVLLKAKEYYKDTFCLSAIHLSLLNKFVDEVDICPSVWRVLSVKEDYGLKCFKIRMFPYLEVESKEWQQSIFDSKKQKSVMLANNYFEVVSENQRKAKKDEKPEVEEDDAKAVDLSAKKDFSFNTNLSAWSILDVSAYTDFTPIVDNIIKIQKLECEEVLFAYISKLVVSPLTCEIIKKKEVWDFLTPLLKDKDFYDRIMYILYYANWTLYHEELLMKAKVLNNYRVLFTLSEASRMPSATYTHLHQNPYLVPVYDITTVHTRIPFYLEGKRSIVDEATFKMRFKIATGGCFEGIDFKKYNASITGSILVPCVHVSPLEAVPLKEKPTLDRKGVAPNIYLIDKFENEEERKFWLYLEKYYPSYASLVDEDYQELFKEPVISTDDPIVKFSKDAETETMQSVTNNITVEDKSTVKVGFNLLADIDMSITCKFEEFKERALEIYYKIKENCQHRGAVYITEIRTLNSLKYKIYGPGICRPIDMFRISHTPAQMVKMFHLHCVRMYYDGELTLFRSCVASLLSGVNESYRWFSCNKIPLDVVLKYAQRGLSIVLNHNEKVAAIKYLEEDTRWGEYFRKINIDNDIFGCVNSNHQFYHVEEPYCARIGLRNVVECDNVETNTYISSTQLKINPKYLTKSNDTVIVPSV